MPPEPKGHCPINAPSILVYFHLFFFPKHYASEISKLLLDRKQIENIKWLYTDVLLSSSCLIYLSALF